MAGPEGRAGDGAASKAGAGAWTIPVSVTPGMAAASAFYHQVFVFDPAAVDLFSASNGLLLDYGF